MCPTCGEYAETPGCQGFVKLTIKNDKGAVSVTAWRSEIIQMFPDLPDLGLLTISDLEDEIADSLIPSKFI